MCVRLLLGLAELLLPPHLLHLFGLLSVLLLHQLPVGLNAAIALTDKSHELPDQLVALLPSLLSGLLVLLLHGPFLPAVGGLPRVILLLPGKVLACAEALPVSIKDVHYLRKGNGQLRYDGVLKIFSGAKLFLILFQERLLFGVGLAYCIIVTLRVSKSGKRLVIILLLHLAVFHLLLNNGLKETPVDCVKALRTE